MLANGVPAKLVPPSKSQPALDADSCSRALPTPTGGVAGPTTSDPEPFPLVLSSTIAQPFIDEGFTTIGGVAA